MVIVGHHMAVLSTALPRVKVEKVTKLTTEIIPGDVIQIGFARLCRPVAYEIPFGNETELLSSSLHPLQLISAVVTNDWRDILETCDLQNWKEALAAVMTYASPEEFSSLCGEDVSPRLCTSARCSSEPYCITKGRFFSFAC